MTGRFTVGDIHPQALRLLLDDGEDDADFDFPPPPIPTDDLPRSRSAELRQPHHHGQSSSSLPTAPVGPRMQQRTKRVSFSDETRVVAVIANPFPVSTSLANGGWWNESVDDVALTSGSTAAVLDTSPDGGQRGPSPRGAGLQVRVDAMSGAVALEWHVSMACVTRPLLIVRPFLFCGDSDEMPLIREAEPDLHRSLQRAQLFTKKRVV